MSIAIIRTGGKQYKVEPGQKIKVEKIETEVGKEVIFDDVLLLQNDNKEVEIGHPKLEKSIVKATVLKQGRSAKIIIFKYKMKKRAKKKKGHRQHFTEVLINEVVSK